MKRKRLAGLITAALTAALAAANPVFAGTVEITGPTGSNGLFDVADSGGNVIAFAHETKDHLAKDGEVWICADPLQPSYYYGVHTTVDAEEVISADLIKEIALGRKYIGASGARIGKTNAAGLAQIYTWNKLKGVTWGLADYDVYPTGGRDEFKDLLSKAETYVREQRDSFDAGGEFSYTPDKKLYQMTFNVWLKEKPKTGKAFIVKKLASLTELQSETPEIYSVKGVTFGVWWDRKLTDESLVGRLITDERGVTEEIELEAGRTYYIKEISCPETISCSDEVAEVVVDEGEKREIEVTDEPKAASGALLVRKRALNGAELPLAGAVYEISYYGMRDVPADPIRAWRFTTDERGEILFGEEQFAGGDDFYTDSNGKPVLPIGRYATKEIAAPEGYFISEETICSEVSLEDGSPVYDTANADEKPIPEISTKAAYESGLKCGQAAESMSVIDTVTCRYLSVGTEYTIKGRLTDACGEIADGTDKNRALASGPISGAERTAFAEASVTFTAENSEETVSVAFDFDGLGLAGKKLVVMEELYEGDVLVCSHSDMEDEEQTVYVAGIETALTCDGKKSIAPESDAHVVDAVKYEGLEPHSEYEIKGNLVRKDTGETIAESTKAFISDESSGLVELRFDFDASKLAGTDVVAFETLYAVDGERRFPVAEHRDINDKGQTVRVEPKPDKPLTGDGVGRELLAWCTVCACTLLAFAYIRMSRGKSNCGLFE